MIKFVLLAAIVAISGCSVPNTKPGDGREWIEVSCNGFSDWTKCYEKAEKFCPGGYDSANREESLIAQHRSMSIACKK